MPANLNNPFGESCCDGGACNTAESAQSCGCDMGLKPNPHYCERHKRVQEEEWWVILDAIDIGLKFTGPSTVMFSRADVRILEQAREIIARQLR